MATAKVDRDAYKRGKAVLKLVGTQVFEEKAAGAERECLDMVGRNREGVGLLSLEDLDRIHDSLAVFADGREHASAVVAAGGT